MLVKPPSEVIEVWDPSCPGALGNVWASCHYFLRLSLERGSVVCVKRQRAIVAECLELIHSPGRVALVDADATRSVDHLLGEQLWNQEYFPTHLRWPGRRFYGRICYQIDGRTRPALTNPPSADVELLQGGWLPSGVELVCLGLPRSVTESVHLLATCDAFLGVDSGISHVAASVGVPMFLLQYHWPLAQAHTKQRYVTCLGMADALRAITKHLGTLMPRGIGVKQDRMRLQALLPRLKH